MTTRADADARFREWMRGNLAVAADHFGLTTTGEPRFGWLDRSIGAAAGRNGERFWLRVVSEQPEWVHLDFWSGNLDANALTGLSKPRVLDTFEWDDTRRQRAEVMTLLPGQPCSPTDVLRAEIDLPPRWWTELRRLVDNIGTVPTSRISTDQDKVTNLVRRAFGDEVDLRVTNWQTVHGDLHWANLLRPDFGLVDWEWWGRGPAGVDAATLLCHSLLVPNIRAKVCEVFADVLDTADGRAAQLYVVARLLRRVTESGDYPDLEGPLRVHSRSVRDRLDRA